MKGEVIITKAISV